MACSDNHVTNEEHYISTSTKLMATKLDREVACDEKMLYTKPHNLLITWTHQITWQIKTVISTISRDLWATKLDRIVTYDKERQTSEWRVLLIMQSRKFTWQIKKRYLWTSVRQCLLNSKCWWLMRRGHPSPTMVT